MEEAGGGGISIAITRNPPAGPADEVQVLVSVQTPPGTERTPSDFVCVIDVSGSMGTEATIQGAGGGNESFGLSLLDVAKHGVKTVIKTLSANDRLSIVSFNNTAEVKLPLTAMTEEGQALAETKLGELHAGGGTNIWNGLFAGLEALREAARVCAMGHVVLLTDGMTSDRERCVPNLKGYKDQYEKLPGTISTMGFGYGIDSPLIVELAGLGDASYSFIPDAGFVGTVFVNTMSNLLVTVARETILTLEVEEGAEILGITGGHVVEAASGGMTTVKLGTLQYEQSKDIVVRMKIPTEGKYLTVAGRYQAFADGRSVDIACAEGGNRGDPVQVERHRLRSMLVDAITTAVQQASDRTVPGLAAAQATMRAAGERIQASLGSTAAGDEKVKALLDDVQGQVAEAFSRKEFYEKWGCHFVPSLGFAHRLQQCNNFKDPGVQFYGGTLFTSTQETADEMFNTLPPPEPTARPMSRGQGRVSSTPAAPVSMAAFNNRYGG